MVMIISITFDGDDYFKVRLKFCGPLINIFETRFTCITYIRNEPRCYRNFTAFRSFDACASEKHCHWKIYIDGVKLYNPKTKKYENHVYDYVSPFCKK